MSKRKLVITADDFGYDTESSKFIGWLLEQNLVTATTLMAVADELPADLSALTPPQLEKLRAGAGLHVTLNSDKGRPAWRSVSRETEMTTDAAAAERSYDDASAYQEIGAQYGKLSALGVEAVRLDSHCGTLYGLAGNPLLGAALQFCAERGLGLRLPRSLDLYFPQGLPEPLAAAHAQGVAAADQLGVALPEVMVTNQWSTAEIGSYDRLLEYYLSVLPRLPEGTSELFMHPSIASPWAREHFGADWDKRVWEGQVLQDQRWLDALVAEDIELVAKW